MFHICLRAFKFCPPDHCYLFQHENFENAISPDTFYDDDEEDDNDSIEPTLSNNSKDCVIMQQVFNVEDKESFPYKKDFILKNTKISLSFKNTKKRLRLSQVFSYQVNSITSENLYRLQHSGFRVKNVQNKKNDDKFLLVANSRQCFELCRQRNQSNGEICNGFQFCRQTTDKRFRYSCLSINQTIMLNLRSTGSFKSNDFMDSDLDCAIFTIKHLQNFDHFPQRSLVIENLNQKLEFNVSVENVENCAERCWNSPQCESFEYEANTKIDEPRFQTTKKQISSWCHFYKQSFYEASWRSPSSTIKVLKPTTTMYTSKKIVFFFKLITFLLIIF